MSLRALRKFSISSERRSSPSRLHSRGNQSRRAHFIHRSRKYLMLQEIHRRHRRSRSVNIYATGLFVVSRRDYLIRNLPRPLTAGTIIAIDPLRSQGRNYRYANSCKRIINFASRHTGLPPTKYAPAIIYPPFAARARYVSHLSAMRN